jgi:intracellular multiplication protein IcmJ
MRQTPQQADATHAAATPAAVTATIVVPPLSLVSAGRWEYQPVHGVKRQMWRKDDEHAHLADTAFLPIKEEVLKRDGYTCRYCNMKSAKYQEVHHLDDNHHNNNPSNLLTVCNLCHQVFHYGVCGMRNAGFVAAIPELTQVEVNQLARAYFVSLLIAEQDVKDKLTGLYASMRNKGDLLKASFALDISSPLLFAEVLSNLDDETFANRGTLMADLRLVPTKQAFHDGQLEYYRINNRPVFLPTGWTALTHQLLG